jgi:pimeloyl-ACP methyl ester carboxylesterase
VTKLCLVNSTAFDSGMRGAARLARLTAAFSPAARALGVPLLAGLVHGSMRRGFADEPAGDRSLEVFLRAFTSRLGVDALVSQLRALHDPSVAALGARLPAIAQPAAIIWGRRDPWLPVTIAERLRDMIPGATIDVIEDARHFTPEDSPARVAAAISALLRRS